MADTSCNGAPVPSNAPSVPQIEAPTTCPSGNLTTTATLATYEGEGHLDTATSEFPRTTGCDQLSFDPSADLALTTNEARSPSGLDLDLTVPQLQGAAIPAPSELRGTEVVFEGGVLLGSGPETMGICYYPGTYNGTDPDCPSDSLMETATIDAGVLPVPSLGHIYYGGEFVFEEEGEEGSGYLVYLTTSGSGFHLGFPLLLFEEENPGGTDMPVLTFESLPQIPISQMVLHLPPATEALRTANKCGNFMATTYFEPWDSALSIQSATNEVSLNSGPGGTPCPGPASNVAVSLSPATVPADGVATTTVTAHVADANGSPVIGDQVEFHSSDAAERIGPVTETYDGVYQATITASTMPGTVTITAVDASATPNVSGSATLEQTGAALRLGPRPVPVATITRHPPQRSHNRRPVFTFISSVPRSRFRCGVDAKPYRPCTSPLRLNELASGKHRFRVVAQSPTGQTGKPVIFRFRVVKRNGPASRSR